MSTKKKFKGRVVCTKAQFNALAEKDPQKEYLVTDEEVDYASLTEQNDFTGINNFNAETNFNEEVNVDNHNVNIHNGYLSTTDENKDLVTKYSADEIVIENGTGGDAKIYNLKLPLKSGALATTDDIKELQPASKEVLGGVYYWIDDEGIPCLSTIKIVNPGLYVDGALSKTWEQLITDGDITITSGALRVANRNLAGDLVCDNVEGLVSLASAFSERRNLTSVDVSKLDTSNVTNMYFTFTACSGLTSLDVSNFDTNKVTNMAYMFSGCSGLTNLDLSNFNTSSVTDMSTMFNFCDKLTSLDISNFTFDKVIGYNGMFYNVPANCEILVKSQTEKDWITSKFANLTNVKIKGVEA